MAVEDEGNDGSKAETQNNATIKHAEMIGEKKLSENNSWKKWHWKEVIKKQRKEGRRTMEESNNNYNKPATLSAESPSQCNNKQNPMLWRRESALSRKQCK